MKSWQMPQIAQNWKNVVTPEPQITFLDKSFVISFVEEWDNSVF